MCGIPLPAGLQNGDRLPEPLFTPAYKAPMGEHDENITFERTVELVGAERRGRAARPSLAIYSRAARDRRGARPDPRRHEVRVRHATPAARHDASADEVLTSDSSRYWDAEAWRTGTTPTERMASFDKQIVRDWLAAQLGPGRRVDARAAEPARRDRHATAARYRELLERLTGAGR